jgi:hypothetical protein
MRRWISGHGAAHDAERPAPALDAAWYRSANNRCNNVEPDQYRAQIRASPTRAGLEEPRTEVYAAYALFPS